MDMPPALAYFEAEAGRHGMRIGQSAATAGLTLCLLASCSGGSSGAGGEVPGDVPVFDGIADTETITALGTEPFWSARVEGSTLTWSTPGNIAGEQARVTRFAGNGGLGVSGTLGGEALQMAVTPGSCSDAMSDRRYPFTVTLNIGNVQHTGCAYTDRQPFEGEENP
ncbi:MAG: COG3650 family protein [Erythrobacter sp.]